MPDPSTPDPDPSAARNAYASRQQRRARRVRSDTQAMHAQREALALAHALRRELATLAEGAADLARQADGNGRGAEAARVRLAGRRARATEALTNADRFGLDPALSELDPGDRTALGLPEQ
jgi:hypothetical protein